MSFPENIYIVQTINFIITILYLFIVIAAVVVVVREKRNPIRALAWVIALIFLPGIGLIFYIFFGRSLRGEMMTQNNKRRMLNSQRNTSEKKKRHFAPSEETKNLVVLGSRLSGFQYTENNKVEIFTDGYTKFEFLKKDLKLAQKSIFLQYYIFLDDKIGNEIADILISKARDGVEVKVIYDHVGSFSAKNSFFKRMEKEGVEIHPFFRVNFPQFANRVNWRNHRKIVVIDGKIGYIGGMNIADRYSYGDGDGKTSWRDTHFRVQGDIIESLVYSFVIDWNFQKNNTYFPDLSSISHNETSNTGLQLVTGGPVNNWNNLSLMFLKAITSARKKIWIQTPYFLPTDALFNAIEAAALAGVDVRIMMPEHTDSVLLHYASFSYISQCIEAGVKIYLYQAGMLHAKSMIIDDSLVIAGSTNFDFRSFENNFECNLFMYDDTINEKMRDIFYEDIKKCIRVNKESWQKRPLGHRFKESVLRLISPIL